MYSESFQFNTAISSLMTLSNEIKKVSDLNTNTKFPPVAQQSALLDSPELARSILSLVGMLYPMAPHFVSEIWQIWRRELDSGLPEAPQWPKIEEEKQGDASEALQTVVVAVCREFSLNSY